MKTALVISRVFVRTRASARIAILTALVALVSAFIGVADASATNGRVLILDSMVSGGASSPEAQAAIAAGKGVDVVDDTTWSAMTTAQFAEYDALILGDPTCGSVSPAAEANALVWGAAVNGNVIIIGTDPVFHLSQGGGTLTNSGVAFAVSASGKTGAYITLTCHYHDTTPLTPVPLLAALGTFTVTGVGCFNDAHIVATHPALTGLTDAALSNWSCSVHEAFDTIAPGFLPLAIALGDHPGAMDFPDGTRGTPYIVARGVRFITNIELSPDSATNPVGGSHTLTATVKENNIPVVGTTVTFTVISGPHAGTTGTGVTDGSGTVQFTYTGTSVGTDTIEASYVDSTGTTRKSNQVTKSWTVLPALSIVDVSVSEGNSGTANAVLTVSLDSASATAVTVDFATADGTAAAPGDYMPASGMLTFAPGETTRPITVLVNGDTVVEPDETFFVSLSNAVGATIADGQAQVTIVNDDAGRPALDHLKCYALSEGDDDDDDDRVARPNVTLEDQFGSGDALVGAAVEFCNPVSKDGGAVNQVNAHLVKYKAKPVGRTFSKRRVEVTNQFGTQILTVRKPAILAVPSSKSTSGPPGDPPTTLDHFQCYQFVEDDDDDDDRGAFRPRTVVLKDQFKEETVRVRRPVALCNPVVKTHAGVVSPIGSPDEHLVCYAIRAGRFSGNVNVSNQFGDTSLRVRRPVSLCVPSQKRELPPPLPDDDD